MYQHCEITALCGREISKCNVSIFAGKVLFSSSFRNVEILMHYWPFFVKFIDHQWSHSETNLCLISASPCIVSFESRGHAFSSCLVVYVGGASFWTGSSLWVLPGPLEGSRLQYVFLTTISPVLRWRCLAGWTCIWNVLLAPTWEGGGHRRVKSCSMRLLKPHLLQLRIIGVSKL